MADSVLGGGSRAIHVIIERAEDLRAADLNGNLLPPLLFLDFIFRLLIVSMSRIGKSDPYVVFDWADRPRTKRTTKTPVVEKNLVS